MILPRAMFNIGRFWIRLKLRNLRESPLSFILAKLGRTRLICWKSIGLRLAYQESCTAFPVELRKPSAAWLWDFIFPLQVL